MRLESLRRNVCAVNRRLAETRLVELTFGNASGIDRESGIVAIKPSGVPYAQLEPHAIVLVDLEGNVVEGDLNPSSDTPTHLHLYRELAKDRGVAGIGGIVHVHSRFATTLCQMGQELPCLGTTHADHFSGTVPVARVLTEAEVDEHYEHATGVAITECFAELDPIAIPGVLLHYHAPFTWGLTPDKALDNALALEMCAEMAVAQLRAGRELTPIPEHLLRKHYTRKHGPDATYGQRS